MSSSTSSSSSTSTSSHHASACVAAVPIAPKQTIMVGNAAVAKIFETAIHKHGASDLVEIDPVTACTITQAYGRDDRVVGLNQIHLLPFSLDTSLLWHLFIALLPSSDKAVIISRDPKLCGNGMNMENARDALASAKNHCVPYRQMRCCIEGGNCYVFRDSRENPKAIIGIRSLHLTIIGLEQQGYFTAHEGDLTALAASISSPSVEAVRIARNMHLYASFTTWETAWKIRCEAVQHALLDKHDEHYCEAVRQASLDEQFMEEQRYKESLIAPITPQDTISYSTEARKWDAKYLLAKRVISEDIGVPVENIAFVLQSDFHIDMEMFVAPDGERVGVDSASYQAPLISALAQIGCIAVPLPGIVHRKLEYHHEGDDYVLNENCIDKDINFMNGYFIPTPTGHLFVTNGVLPKFEKMAVAFQEIFRCTFPDIEVVFLDPMMQEILTRCSAGIHCFTWEKPTYVKPIEIIASYLADEPVPETRLRAKLHEFIPALY